MWDVTTGRSSREDPVVVTGQCQPRPVTDSGPPVSPYLQSPNLWSPGRGSLRSLLGRGDSRGVPVGHRARGDSSIL